jgi:hypothetical protein
VNSTIRVQRLAALGLCITALSIALAGCTWFDQGRSVLAEFGARTANKPTETGKNANPLQPIPVPPDAIQLEAICIEGPAGDPMLGPQLWQEVSTVGSIPSERRDALRQHGFRIGQVSVTPPRALQSLLSRAAESDRVVIDTSHKSTRHRFTLLAGTRGEVSASDLYPECTLQVPGAAGEKTATFEQSRFVLSMTAERLQEGWARLDFLPEIHHGAMALRPTVSAGQFRTSQNILPLYTERFSVELAEGEMIVIAAQETDDDSLASWFFRSTEANSPTKRILVVRLVEMEKMRFLYSERQ